VNGFPTSGTGVEVGPALWEVEVPTGGVVAEGVEEPGLKVISGLSIKNAERPCIHALEVKVIEFGANRARNAGSSTGFYRQEIQHADIDQQRILLTPTDATTLCPHGLLSLHKGRNKRDES